MRISKIWCVAAVGVVALAGCGDSPSAPAPVPTTLQIEPGEVSLAMGASQQLSATQFDETGAPMTPASGGAEVTWSSEDSTVVTIDETGMVVGRKAGSTTIVARAGALEASIAAVVVPVELVLESERSVSAVIGFAGGVLVAEGAGGIRYRLEIPPAAVIEETTITLTPVASFGNAPFMQLLGAARFAPDGLQLLNPGVLTIEFTQAPPTGQIITGFTFSDDAQDLALWSANVNGMTATMPIAHFSGAGVARVEEVGFYGRNATFAEPLVGIIIRMLDVQIEHQQTGVWDVPELIDLLRQWYLEIIEPRLDGAVTSDEVFDAISSWRLWLSWLLEAGGGSVDVRGAVVEALGTEIDEARVLAAAALAQGIASENAECITKTNWVHAMTVAVLQQVAEEFGLAEPGTGLDAATVQAEICVQVHHVDVIFPLNPVRREPAQLVVRTGIGYGGGTPVESGSIRTWITTVGSTDDSETSEESVEVIRRIVPTGETSLTIHLRSCIALELPAHFSVQLNRVCAEDIIVRPFEAEEEDEGLDLSGSWTLVVNNVCQGPLTIVQTGTNLNMSGSIGGQFCPFSASGSGTGGLDGLSINFGIAFGTGADGSGSGLGTVTFQGLVDADGTRMSGTYEGGAGDGTWSAQRR